MLDAFLTGRRGYTTTDTGRMVDWDEAMATLSTTERAVVASVKELMTLERVGTSGKPGAVLRRYLETLFEVPEGTLAR